MTVSLGELAAEAAFPLYCIPVRHWPGDAFVGDLERLDGRLMSATIVYQDLTAERGAGVINADARAAGATIDDDLTRFVARFDPAYVTRRVKRRKRAFPPGAFEAKQVDTTVAGDAASLEMLGHKDLPLQAIAMRLGGSATDVWVAAWNTEARDIVPLLESVDTTLVAAFDDRGEPYPPPEWTE